MGVLMSSSFLMMSSIPRAGLLGISEGKVAVEGVFKAGSDGFGEQGVLMAGMVGVGVGEDDDVGDADDESDPSVAEVGGDDASDDVAEGMMLCSAFTAPGPYCQTSRRGTTAMPAAGKE